MSRKVWKHCETREPRWPWIAHLNFWEDHSQFFLSLSAKNLQEFLYVHILQVAPIHLYHVCWHIKISQTIFEKGHPSNFSMKLFQSLTSGFIEEDYLGICSCQYSESSPYSIQPYLMMDQNFTYSFWKRSLKEEEELLKAAWFQEAIVCLCICALGERSSL